MSKNVNQSRLDMGQLWKRMFHIDYDALRVVQVNDIQTEISLSHSAGDSIVSKVHSKSISTTAIPVDCSDLKRIMAFVVCQVVLHDAGSGSYTLNLNPGDVKEICAMTLTCTAPIVGQ